MIAALIISALTVLFVLCACKLAGKQLPRMDKRHKDLTSCEFMHGLTNAPHDSTKCEKCGGTGYFAIMCCSGHECGCRGMPIDFWYCPHGCKQASEKQIKKWSDEAKKGGGK